MQGNIRETFAYDGAGNQVARYRGVNPAQNRAVRYDLHHRPERVAPTVNALNGVTEFRYAPSGERYLQRRSTLCNSSYCTRWEFTLYPIAGYELEGAISTWMDYSSQPPTLRRRADFQKARQRLGGWGLWLSEYGGAMPMAVWQHGDRLGSIVAKTRSDGTVLTTGLLPGVGHPERHGYDAFGKPRLGSWADTGVAHQPGHSGMMNSSATPRGFTQHEHLDAYQLIHMSGRAYDPLLGRFLSVDPIIQFPANGQSLNPYSYIMNNPLAGTDPTGYVACGDVGLDKPGSGTCDFTNAQGQTMEVGYSIGSNGDVAVGETSNMGSISGAVSYGVQQSNGSAQGQSSFGVMRTDRVAEGPSSLMSDRSKSSTGCYGQSGSMCHASPQDSGPGFSMPRGSKVAEFGLGLTGLGGTALSAYELMSGTSPLSGDSASRGWAAVGLIPWARNLKYGVDVVEQQRAYSTLLEARISKQGIGRRDAHFKDANEQLAAMIRSDDDFANTMTQFNVAVPTSSTGRVLGTSPDNWTWHHAPDRPGVLQLVPRGQHRPGSAWQHLLHPDRKGGFKIWGSEY